MHGSSWLNLSKTFFFKYIKLGLKALNAIKIEECSLYILIENHKQKRRNIRLLQIFKICQICTFKNGTKYGCGDDLSSTCNLSVNISGSTFPS